MMTITPRSAHSQSRVPAPDAGDGEPLTVGVGVVLVRHRISAQRISSLEAQADGLALVGGAPGPMSSTTSFTG